MPRYRIFDLNIDSELPVPGWAAAAEGPTDVFIRRGPLDPLSQLLPWQAAPGSFRFDGIARYAVHDGREIVIDGDDTLFLTDSPMSALLMQRGCLPLHASAVDTPDGAVLIMGESGSGKSTLAAALVSRGLALLSDDFCALRFHDGIQVLPGASELRLWPSALALVPRLGVGTALRRTSAKLRVQVPGAFAPRPLRALVLLPPFSASPVTIGTVPDEVAAAVARIFIHRSGYLSSFGWGADDALAALAGSAQCLDVRRPRDLGRVGEAADRLLAALSPRKAPVACSGLAQLTAPPPFCPEPQRRLLVLASYPKSGNTWVRTLLTAWRTAQEPNLNALDGVTPLSSRFNFEEALGLDSQLLSADELLRWSSRMVAICSSQMPRVVPTKTHSQPTRSGDVWLFPPEAVARAIHVVRNPLDVVLSFAPHFQLTLPRAVDFMSQRDTQLDASDDGSNPVLPVQLGSWSDHAAAWLAPLPYPVLLLRYEDLLDDPLAQLQKIVAFLGEEWDDSRGRECVRRCDFGALQSQERTVGFAERPAALPTFFRAGRAGQWRTDLPPELAQRICSQHGEMMRRLGYGDDVDSVLSGGGRKTSE